MNNSRTIGIVAGVAVALLLAWANWNRPSGPPAKYVFAVHATPRFELERPDVAIEVEPRVGDVSITFDGQSLGSTPVTINAGQKLSVEGTIHPSEIMPNGQTVENVVIGLAYRDRYRLGWSIVGDHSIGGPSQLQVGEFVREIDGAWTVPDVRGEASIIVLVTITQTGKTRPLHTAGLFPVVIKK